MDPRAVTYARTKTYEDVLAEDVLKTYARTYAGTYAYKQVQVLLVLVILLGILLVLYIG